MMLQEETRSEPIEEERLLYQNKIWPTDLGLSVETS